MQENIQKQRKYDTDLQKGQRPGDAYKKIHTLHQNTKDK